jgi:hypothetical protein
MAEKKEFLCPICGSEKYKEKTISNGVFGPGGRTWVVYYECAGCSVRFGNPIAFSKAQILKRVFCSFQEILDSIIKKAQKPQDK